MIEKLNPLDVYSKLDVVSISAMSGKIDELVDAVNELQESQEWSFESRQMTTLGL